MVDSAPVRAGRKRKVRAKRILTADNSKGIKVESHRGNRLI